MFPNLGGRIQSLIIHYDVSCGLIEDALYWVKEVHIYCFFAESLDHELILNFVECFFRMSWDNLFFFVYEYGELYGLVFKCWTNLEFLKWNLTSCIVLVFLYITGFYLLFSIFFICISFFSPHFFHSLLLIEYFLISSFSLLSWLIYTSQNF